MRLIFIVFFTFSLTHFCSIYAVPNGHDIAIAPFKETYVVDINESEELFENSPTYDLDNPRQVLRNNGWKGHDDFVVQTRLFWSSNSIFIRFDIVDDTYIQATDRDPDKINGDFIQINLGHLTCGPDRKSIEPWSILVFPDVENESCELILHTDSEVTRSKIGHVECTLFRTIKGYSMIVKLPYDKWDDLPRRGGMTRLQTVFGDSDSHGEIDHRFVLFPVNPRKKKLHAKTSEYGNIRYAETTWVTVYPRDTVYSQHKATFLLDIGNLTERPLEVNIYPEEAKSRRPFEGLNQENQVKYPLPANTVKQRVPVELNFRGVPSGTYRINGKSGVFYDSGAFVVKYSEKSGLIYCPNLIERRRKKTIRNLNILKDPEGTKATFHHLAGDGGVLWSAGKYDASSKEFPQYIRRFGDHVIDVPQAGNKEIPWALFGGLDALDNMNEPLVLSVAPELDNPDTRLSPDEPLIQSRRNPSRKVRESYKYLLLLGVVTEYIDENSFPEIHIFTNTKTLLKQTIRPTAHGGAGKEHVYVFHIWLSTLEKDIKIENSATYGSKLEIDFIALMGASKESNFDAGGSSVSFSGNELATIFSKQIKTSKFLLKHYLVDVDGKAYSSLPGGRYQGINLRDWGLLTSELAAWGCMEQASHLAHKLPLILGKASIPGLSSGFTIGNSLMITSIYNTWKKLGKNKSFLEPIWLSCIHKPLTDLTKEVETNPLRLVNCAGEFGADDREDPAATLPMYFATQAAFASGVAMATESGYSENSASWKSASDRLATGFKRHLLSTERQVRLVSQEVFPESWGIKEQVGIASLLPKDSWIYGRHLDEQPVFYNDKVRVFDTPYLFSGVSFWCDYNGFSLSDETSQQLNNSFDYALAFSPVFRKPTWSKYYMVDYNKSVLQLWTVMAGFLLDSLPIGTNALANYIKYSFDQFVSIPEFSDIEVSPFTFEEKLNTSVDGENSGATHDDLNILNGVTALKIARLIAGIDDYDSSVLNLIPRLPQDWKRLEVKNWRINHDSAQSGTTTIHYSYKEITDGRYELAIESSNTLDAVTVRMGPFAPKTRKVRISVGDIRTNVPTFRHGFHTWATKTFKKVKSLNVVSQEIIY